MTVILACSDLHCDETATRTILAQAGKADILVVAGDLGTKGQGAEPVLDLLRAAPCPVVLVPGNHDNLTALRRYCHDWPDGHLLQGDGVTVRGIPFFGLGGEIPRRSAAVWNLSLTEEQAGDMLKDCPAGAVLVTHTPPKGHCDRQLDGTHEGSAAILACVQEKQPRLNLCGHIHASFGAASQVGSCDIRNLGPVENWFSL